MVRGQSRRRGDLLTHTLGRNSVQRLFWLALLAVLAWLAGDFLVSTYLKYRGLDPDSLGMFVGRQGWLYTHIAGGTLTIILGLAQLLKQRLEPARPVHRWIGRLYLVGMLIACCGSVGLISTSPAPDEIRVAFAVTMTVWVSTATLAVAAVLRRRLLVHRTWMLRNYVVTLAPVAFRLLLPAAIALGLEPSPKLIAALLWASWSLPLLLFEVLQRMPGIRDFGLTSAHNVECPQ